MRTGPVRTAARAMWVMVLVVQGCDDEETAEPAAGPASFQPSQADLAQGITIATHSGVGAAVPRSGGKTPPLGNGDLSELGGKANQNQQAFRERYNLHDPTREELAQWQGHDARLTSYSDKDADWPYPTAASANWTGSAWTNGDPLAIEGTTVAVDFNRIPRGSLIYIAALNMYAEANDTGATGMWAQDDAGQSDYGSYGAGRVDIYHLAGDRSSRRVEGDFENWVGNNEYGQVYVVYRGPGWKKGGK